MKIEGIFQTFESDDLFGAFNSEIYNLSELISFFKLHIENKSNTEVIVCLYEKTGSKLIHYIDGFYSGFIFNKTTKQTFLVRDYIGKKPLFIVETDAGIKIFNELKNIHDIKSFQIAPKGFSELIGSSINLTEVHEFENIPKDKLKETLVNSVLKYIPKNQEKFGVFLSGGLDSSIIAYIIVKHTDNVIYYTLGNTDDLNFVQILAKHLGIENKIKKVKLPKQNELTELIEKVVYHTESYNPSIISNGLATYLLSEQAHKDGLKVVLSGEGADELFCGYTVSNNINEWFEKRVELIENMHFTECRRLDMASMAHDIEVRCPFLDKQVYFISNECSITDLIKDFQGKYILRKTFEAELPKEITKRAKMSFDVGSGIRKMVVEFLTKKGNSEKEELKIIWDKYFQKSLSNNFYFHSYPTFDKAIAKRGVSHKRSELHKIEDLLLREFETVPFHNLFMLNNKNNVGSELGGTCSDKVLHFKKVLSENNIDSKLHSAYINELECHRMLSVEIEEKRYFIDVGSGWPSIKLFPSFEEIEYSVYGMTFKTKFSNENLLLFHKTNEEFKLMVTIPLKSKPENKILADIADRFNDKMTYPFQNSLRFSKVIGDSFYFLKGNNLRIYTDNLVTEKILSKTEVRTLIQNDFKFNLHGLKKWYTQMT